MRAYRPDEIRTDFLDQLHALVEYWSSVDGSVEHKLNGLAFSILVNIDGCGALPAMDLVCRPHPDDKQDHIDNGENWIENGTVITDVPLHERWYQGESNESP